MNHGCRPNGKLVEFIPDYWNDDLVLFIYVTTVFIPKGAQVTMDYGGDMWQPLDQLPRTLPSNTRRVVCGCANPCPKRMGRLDWIERKSHSKRHYRTHWNHSSDSLVLDSEVPVEGAELCEDLLEVAPGVRGETCGGSRLWNRATSVLNVQTQSRWLH